MSMIVNPSIIDDLIKDQGYFYSVVLFSLKRRFSFFQKSLHALFLILCAETLSDTAYFQLVGVIQR